MLCFFFIEPQLKLLKIDFLYNTVQANKVCIDNRINIKEYQLLRSFVYYGKVLSYLPSLSYNSNITTFLNLMM